MMNFIMKHMMINILYLFFLLLLVLVSVAFLTLFERKILGYIQNRKGPNKVGILGLLQPFSDVIKLLNKEFFVIDKLNYYYYYMSSMMILFLSMILWGVYYFYSLSIIMNMGVLYMLSVMSLGVYPIMLGGWSSNSNYSMLGCLRSVSQSISFEVSLFLIIFVVMIMFEGYSLILIKNFLSFVYILVPIYLMFLVSMLIEMNRTPFDLVEGESELVSGFNTEYFGGCFALIFMAEYLSIIFMGYLVTVMFFSGCLVNSGVFVFIWMYHIFFIIWIRGVLPRVRYDELMYLCWKKFLSITLLYLMFIIGVKMLMLVFYDLEFNFNMSLLKLVSLIQSNPIWMELSLSLIGIF